MGEHTPGPWTWRDVSGAGLQISATLPEGFKFDGTTYGADGKTSFMVWTVRERYTVQIADERWVQFSTGPWSEMQRANAQLISAAPDMLVALQDYLHVQQMPFDHPDIGEAMEAFEARARAAIRKATEQPAHESYATQRG